MPSTVTHAYMARDIYNKLDDNLKNKFKNYLDYYITFSEGPDAFFFYPILPSKKSIHIRKFASVVHRTKVNELFIRLVNYIKKTKDFDEFVFLAGLVTHYVGDSTCHPFVNYKDWLLRKKNNNKKDYHFVTEAYSDNYILRKKGEYYSKFVFTMFLKKKIYINIII